MEQIEYDHRTFQNPNAEDDKLVVKFYMDAVEDHVKTKAEGRPIFRDVEFILIQIPGDLLKTIKRPVRDLDKRRFVRQYQLFKAGGDQERHEGTPLAQWPLITRGQVEEMKHFKVFTVEQMAGLSDSAVQKIMGAQQLKNYAKDWLSKAENNKEIVALRNTNDAQAQQIAELNDAVKKLSAQITESRGNAARR